MALDLTQLVAAPGFKPREWQSAMPDVTFGHRPSVSMSPEIIRVRDLPRRPPVELGSPSALSLAQTVTARMRRQRVTPCTCAQCWPEQGCITNLREIQATALVEIYQQGGLLGPIGVGHGKSFLDLLTPLVLQGCRVALLLVPPGLVEQLVKQYQQLAQHFHVPAFISHGKPEWSNLSDNRTGDDMPVARDAPALHVLPYSKLSRPESTAWIAQLRPDVIIADEVDAIRHADSARGARVLRYFEETNPEARFCGWTGSMTESSICDYAHLANLALRERSPLPRTHEVAKEWGTALDPGPNPAPEGALIEFASPGENILEAFHRRLVETPGVVHTDTAAVDVEISITEREPGAMPLSLAGMIADVRNTAMRPDGEEFADPMRVAACLQQLACGFYYRWIFPRGEKVADIEAWLDARKSWNKELRAKLKDRAEHLDSPLLCARAARRAWGDEPITDSDIEIETEDEENDLTVRRKRHRGGNKHLPVWKAVHWPRWRDLRYTVQPDTEAVLVDDYLAADAAAWARSNRGIVWYQHNAFGAWIGKISGLPVHGGGPGAGQRISAERGDRSIVASIGAHGRGRDGLQFIFDDQLVSNPPPNATKWEQMLGRLARPGQKSPIVHCGVYRHTPELQKAIDQAVGRAQYVQSTLGARQKILTGFRIDG